MEEINEHLSQVSIEEEQLPSVTPKPNLRIVDKETEEYEEERTEEYEEEETEDELDFNSDDYFEIEEDDNNIIDEEGDEDSQEDVKEDDKYREECLFEHVKKDKKEIKKKVEDEEKMGDKENGIVEEIDEDGAKEKEVIERMSFWIKSNAIEIHQKKCQIKLHVEFFLNYFKKIFSFF